MREIMLTNGKYAFIDDDDFELVSTSRWYFTNGYAKGYVFINKRKVTTSMHRLVMGLQPGDKRIVDHIDHNPLNNTKRNLRICSSRQNAHNRNLLKNNTTGFKGVSKTVSGSFVANLSYKGHSHYLGTFKTAKEAHEAYCELAKNLHGEFANFGKGSVLIHKKPSKKPINKNNPSEDIVPFKFLREPKYSALWEQNNLHKTKN